MSLATTWERYRSWPRKSRERPLPADAGAPPGPTILPATMAAELEQLRREAIRTTNLRSLWMIPGGALLAIVACWIVTRDSSILLAVSAGVIGAGFGWAFAADPPLQRYRTAYKDRIIPLAAAHCGDLQYREPAQPDLTPLVELSFLPRHGTSVIKDELFGEYRGARVSVVQAYLRASGKYGSDLFNGLLLQLQLPGRFSGTTLITGEDLLDRMASAVGGRRGLYRVAIDDGSFTRHFRVYGSDELEARALLNPPMRERLVALADACKGDPPRFLVEPGRFWAALPRPQAEDLFEPPSIGQPVTDNAALAGFARNVAGLMKLLDAVVDLYPTRM